MNRGNRLSIDSTIELYERIDATCDAFEQAWQAGQHPEIEPFLLDYPPDERASVFRELFAVELEYCRNAAETVDREAWFQQFPEFQTIIDDGFGRPDETGILAGASTSDVIPVLLPPADDFTNGQSLGRLKLLERIGEGGFGIVWRASDPDLDRQVAIKLSRKSHLSSIELNRLLEEARSVARLRHPNIATVHEVANHAGVPYIVSEFIEGDSLKVARSRWRASRDAARLCAKVARALHHAHERGVMHLDVKPANILLDTSGEPHLVDFGLARRLSVTDPSTSSPAPGSIAGTPAYMAPEQVAAGKLPVDARADVYALGVVLYELLTEKRPFGGSTPQVLRQIVEDAPVPLRQRDPKIPRELEAICLKALQKAPAARYATASDFADDLERFLRGESIAARPAKLLQSCRWVRRHWVASLLTVSCLLLGGVAAWSIVTRPEGPERSVLLSTNPEGAEVYFIPRDKRTGAPEPEKIVHAGRSPVNVDLLPGDYLVEVVWDDGRFHEVYRRVPEKVEVLSDANRHRHWKKKPGGRIEFYAVDAPPSDVAKDMVLIQGVEPSMTGQNLVANDAHDIEIRERVRSFLIDPTEATVADFKHAKGGTVLLDDRYIPKPDDFPITITYDMAVGLAEELGKRLPDEMEYELAASYRESPDQKELDTLSQEILPHTQLKPVRHPTLDRLPIKPEVIGLFSNAAEWTMTRESPKAIHFTDVEPYSGAFDAAAFHIHVARGGIFATGKAADTSNNNHPGIYRGKHRGRILLVRTVLDNTIGLRCVRSLRPRLTRADFLRPALDK